MKAQHQGRGAAYYLTHAVPAATSPLDMTLAQWLNFWLEHYIRPNKKPAGFAQYKDLCTGHIIPEIGEIPLRDITGPILQLFFNEQSEHGNLKTGGPLSAKSIKNMRVLLDVAFRVAVEKNGMGANPVRDTVIPAVHRHAVVPLTEEMQKELERFLFADDNLQNMGILLALYTGCRLGEICALRWVDIDTDKNELHLRQTVKRLPREVSDGGPATALTFSGIKGSQPMRIVPIPPVVERLLAFQRARAEEKFRGKAVGVAGYPTEYVVYNRNGQLTDPDNLSHYFGEVLTKIGLPHARYHDLRHTFSCRAIENGMDILTLSGLLGHADVRTTEQFYLHPRLAAMRRAMQTIVPEEKGLTFALPGAHVRDKSTQRTSAGTVSQNVLTSYKHKTA